MKQQWITCWSKAQRGMGLVSRLYTPHQCVHVNVMKASSFLLRFAFYYDEQDVTITHVTCTSATSKQKVTFAGEASVCMRASTMLVSDVIAFDEEVEEITISYDLMSEQSIASGISLYPYDPVSATHDVVYGLCGIDAYTSDRKGCIRVVGDSISEQGNWTTPLANRLSTQGYHLLNHGISGNRMLRALESVQIDPAHAYMFEGTTLETDNQKIGLYQGIPLAKQCFGIAGRIRIEKQMVMQDQGIQLHLIALGTNDLYQPGTFCADIKELPTCKEMMDSFRACIQMIKAQGSKCIVLAIPPFYHADKVDQHKETLRQEINHALMKEQSCDAVIQFDDLLSDEEGGLKEGYHQGDHLHPNTFGGEVMAKRIQEVLTQWLG